MDSTKTVRLVALAVACGSLCYVAFLTLSPIEMRPVVANIRVEHLGAYAVIGASFGLAFPRRLLASLLFVVASGACLEAAQLLEPDRHGRWLHFGTKAIGAVLGVAIAYAANVIIDRYRPSEEGVAKATKNR